MFKLELLIEHLSIFTSQVVTDCYQHVYWEMGNLLTFYTHHVINNKHLTSETISIESLFS